MVAQLIFHSLRLVILFFADGFRDVFLSRISPSKGEEFARALRLGHRSAAPLWRFRGSGGEGEWLNIKVLCQPFMEV